MNYVSMLNQTVMMSTQLYNDATNPAHHKYTAHQVALLYVSMMDKQMSSSSKIAATATAGVAGVVPGVHKSV